MSRAVYANRGPGARRMRGEGGNLGTWRPAPRGAPPVRQDSSFSVFRRHPADAPGRDARDPAFARTRARRAPRVAARGARGGGHGGPHGPRPRVPRWDSGARSHGSCRALRGDPPRVARAGDPSSPARGAWCNRGPQTAAARRSGSTPATALCVSRKGPKAFLCARNELLTFCQEGRHQSLHHDCSCTVSAEVLRDARAGSPCPCAARLPRKTSSAASCPAPLIATDLCTQYRSINRSCAEVP